MSKNYIMGDDVIAQKKPLEKAVPEKEFAEELLQSEGYVPAAKPRRVNGGKEPAGARSTEANKVRLNKTLSKTPEQARPDAAQERKQRNVRKTKKRLFEFSLYSKREKSATPFPISYIFFICSITVMLVYIVHLCIEVSDIDSAMAESNNMLVELKSEQNTLVSEKNKLVGKYIEEVEEIARTKYGMVSADQVTSKYRDNDGGDTIDIPETAEEKSAAGVLMSGFGSAVSNFLSYIN